MLFLAGAQPSVHEFLGDCTYARGRTRAHTARLGLKLTLGNTLPSIMQTNIFIALFGGWHDL